MLWKKLIRVQVIVLSMWNSNMTHKPDILSMMDENDGEGLRWSLIETRYEGGDTIQLA